MSILTALFPGGAPELIKKHDSFVHELQETQDERHCRGVVEGCMTVTEPFYTTRNHERAMLKIDGATAGIEWTSIPWNIFKEITVSYWMYIDYLVRQDAEDLMVEAGVSEGWTEEDPYADPVRWGVHVRTIEDAVKVWKLYKSKPTPT